MKFIDGVEREAALRLLNDGLQLEDLLPPPGATGKGIILLSLEVKGKEVAPEEEN